MLCMKCAKNKDLTKSLEVAHLQQSWPRRVGGRIWTCSRAGWWPTARPGFPRSRRWCTSGWWRTACRARTWCRRKAECRDHPPSLLQKVDPFLGLPRIYLTVIKRGRLAALFLTWFVVENLASVFELPRHLWNKKIIIGFEARFEIPWSNKLATNQS